ncbi:glycosyltransferase family 2 protein [Streptomyces sp. NPDC059248]|uniref:glycosyltransferase family 2 protein n=1 Tax=Streptomyces sp. NPDC059248 TaxID=3346791 RepID=UPI0036A225B3
MSSRAVPGGQPSVSVVVITYNDAVHVADAVRSALAQGPVVSEVVVVDDHSSDDTPTALAAFDGEPRVRVVRRETNSGGCGTPRNDGIAAATGTHLLFLDSDDLLVPGAADALLAVAREHDADVTAGVCVRRELPGGRETVWAPGIYDREQGAELPGTVVDGIADHPELLHDTLSVNKLYRRAFLMDHGLTFPDGAFHYEDFVFTAGVYAAAPRIAVTDVPVYVWHVRRSAATLSISLRRASIANWEHRLAAHAGVVEVFRKSGLDALATAARTKFVDYDLPMYLRELPQRSAEYKGQWWTATRAHLAEFDPAAVAAARPAARWSAAALLHAPEPYAVPRLVELAAPRPRLIPPYATGDGGAPVLAPAPGDVPLDGLAALPPDELPLAVDGRVTIGSAVRLSLTVHELYGRLAALGPVAATVTLTERTGAAPALTVRAPLLPGDGCWEATPSFSLDDLVPSGRLAAWAVEARVEYADGSSTTAEVRSVAGQSARRRVVVKRGRPFFVQAGASPRRALVLRTADGVEGVRRVIGGRLRRLMARR